MTTQVEIFMFDHDETCFNLKWNLFHEFWMKNMNAIESWLVGLMESLMKEKISSLKEMHYELR